MSTTEWLLVVLWTCRTISRKGRPTCASVICSGARAGVWSMHYPGRDLLLNSPVRENRAPGSVRETLGNRRSYPDTGKK
jgi:hypothetical protein